MNKPYALILVFFFAMIFPLVNAGAADEEHRVEAKPGKVTLNDAIDFGDEQTSTPSFYRKLGDGKIAIKSKIFIPPTGREFVKFEGSNTHVDIQAVPGATFKRIKDESEKIQIYGLFVANTAANFPLRGEGNLNPVPKTATKGGKPKEEDPKDDHWSAKIGGVVCVLTLDDGPHPSYTQVVLDTLKKNAVQPDTVGAFFIQTHSEAGRGNTKKGKLLVTAEDKTHVVCIHTGSTKDHVKHTTRVKAAPYDANGDGKVDNKDGANGLESDLIRAQLYLKNLLGHTTNWVRAPYGATNNAVFDVYSRQKLGHIYWDIDSEDWNRKLSVDDIIKRLKKGMKRNISRNNLEVVVLLHDIQERTKDNLEKYMKALKDAAKEEGLELVFTKTKKEVEDIFSRKRQNK